MTYRYPKSEPKWTQATQVEAATLDISHVHVKAGDDLAFRMCKVEWSNPLMDKSKSDVLVESQEYGCLRIWFNDADVQPYRKVQSA